MRVRVEYVVAGAGETGWYFTVVDARGGMHCGRLGALAADTPRTEVAARIGETVAAISDRPLDLAWEWGDDGGLTGVPRDE
ncbi:MAG TPA: hypothetical protein VNQ77_17745 [Frankiaceae bacterium]|nr:hypothetical protein [Frankiaceae bacterium]